MVVGLAVLVLYGLLYVGCVRVFAWMDGRPPDWARPLGPMIGGSLGPWFVLRRQRRRMGGYARARAFARAVRRRRLPDDADPAVWGPLLEGERRALRRAQTVDAPVAAAVFAAVAIVSSVVIGFRWSVVLAILGAAVALVSVAWLTGRRNLARIDLLADQLSRN